MAFTANVNAPNGTTFGNMKVVMGILTAPDANGTAVGLGLDTIAGVSVTIKSHVTTTLPKWVFTGSSLAGTAATGSDFYVIAWGH